MQARDTVLFEIAREFGIDFAMGDLAQLRAELNRRRIAVHPDHDGGEFHDQRQEQEYIRLNSCIKLVDSFVALEATDRGSLALVSSEGALVPKILSQPGSHRPSIDPVVVSSIRRNARTLSRQRVFIPRITSAALLALCSFLVAFPSQVTSHPLFSAWIDQRGLSLKARVFCEKVVAESMFATEKLGEGDGLAPADGESVKSAGGDSAIGLDSADSPRLLEEETLQNIRKLARSLGVYSDPSSCDDLITAVREQETRDLGSVVASLSSALFLISLVMLVSTWRREQLVRAAVEHLATIDGLQDVVRDLLSSHRESGGFGFRDLIVRLKAGVAGAPRLEGAMAEEVASGLIDRLIQLQAITRGRVIGLDPWFEFSAGALDQGASLSDAAGEPGA